MLVHRNQFLSFARGFSILTIVVYHYVRLLPLPGLAAKAVMIGGTGVHLFIFLSGYGLSLSRFSGWPAFYQRRFSRVLVPYFLGITLIFGVNLLLPIYVEGWREYLSHVFLYKMFNDYNTRSYGGHFWFISTIIQFYLVFPLIRWFVGYFPARQAILISLGISLAYSGLLVLFGQSDNRAWSSCFLQYFWEFVLGMVVARTQLLPRLLGYRWPVYVVTGGLGLGTMAALVVLAGPAGKVFNDVFGFLGYTSGCILLYRVGQRVGWLQRFVLWVETFSFSLYILHMFVLGFYLKVLVQRPLALPDVPVVLLAAFGLAILYEKVIQVLLRPRDSAPDNGVRASPVTSQVEK